jgi:hypothetical protein
MASTTWRGMSPNGSTTGSASIITPTCRNAIRPDRPAAATRACAAGPGKAGRSCSGPPPAAARLPISAPPPWAFAAPNRCRLSRTVIGHDSRKLPRQAQVRHSQTFQPERQVAGIPEQRHLKQFEPLHERHRIFPSGQAVKVPHLPEPAADQRRKRRCPKRSPIALRRAAADRRLIPNQLQRRDQQQRRDPHQREEIVRPQTDSEESRRPNQSTAPIPTSYGS